MRWLFSFEGRVGRIAYLSAAAPALLIPYLIVPFVWGVADASARASPWLLIAPARWVIETRGDAGLFTHDFLTLAALALTVLGGWIGAALATRRARDAGLSDVIAALALTPVVQWILMVALAISPPRAPSDEARTEPSPPTPARGLLIGVATPILAVAVGALVFRTYGFGLFVGTPILIGLASALDHPKGREETYREALRRGTRALVLGGVALLGFALEGGICILMAAPLAWVAMALGVGLGHALTKLGRGRSTLSSVSALPLLLILQQAVTPPVTFFDTRSVEVAASTDAVWRAVIRMRTIEEPPAAPFRLGVAYPVSGEVEGEGVGAIRRGHFSTGDAVERVTEWKPGQALGFTILSEPPVMRELSPYPGMTTPHLEGYFRSLDARIVLQPIAPGRTRLTLETRHALDLQPGSYWLPFARWIVWQNKVRVLNQMRRQAEAEQSAQT